MTNDTEQFATAVRSVTGAWATSVKMWSFSSLSGAEACPRQWMLMRASYPTVWDGHGYPQRPNVPAIQGSVIHGALERILRDVHSCGCNSLADPDAVETIRGLGGYSKLIESGIENQLGQFAGNPRASAVITAMRAGLVARLPDMRHKLQSLLARTSIEAGSAHDDQRREAGPAHRGPLGEGSHPEVQLRADDLRCVGRADLITVADGTCTITDYKTGQPADSHAEQLRFYALLWSRDRELNPSGWPIKRLVLSYGTHDEVVAAPTAPELTRLAEELAHRISYAESQLRLRPPPARPAAESCPHCAVRHLCDEYWASPVAQITTTERQRESGFGDTEVQVGQAKGSRSWEVTLVADGKAALLRTPTETADFRAGDRLRLLDVAFGRDADSGLATLTMTRFSESFTLSAPS